MSGKGLESVSQLRAHGAAHEDVRAMLREIVHAFEEKPFRPHPLFSNGHAQTLAAYAWPRSFALRGHRRDAQRLFEAEPGVRLLAHCRWQQNRTSSPTIVLMHGLEGSSESIYLLSIAAKAFRAGFNVLRLNMRNCGGTEHLTPTLYNSGLSGDPRAVIEELIERDQLRRIFLVGFSMSGNIALKLAGEYAERAPRELAGICAVSPSVDLSACADAIEQRQNRLYQQRFMRSLRRRVRRKQQLYPELYDTTDLHLVRTIRDFDERFTTVDGGYSSAADYYARASSLPLIQHIRIPTLIIHAQDDPFIPFHPLSDPSVGNNTCVLLLAPPHGGHVGFLSAATTTGEDRFWAENRVVEFCKLAQEHREM